ncbi:hypothetical protein PF001_g25264 [Phytophthora fragariae]|nr:hypothetical protein PF001_g25264 [Phytophthora fragariae]
MIGLEQVLLTREHVERDYADLEGRVADFRARAERTEAAETLLRVERDSSTEQYRDLQAQVQAAQDQVADYAAQLMRASATPSSSSVPLARLFAAQGERDDARAERDDLRVDLAAAQAALSPVQARADAAEAERDRVRQLVVTAEQQRDDDLAERDRVTRVLVVAEQERDGALDMRDQARQISTALRRERDAAVTERDQARHDVAALEQQRDAAVAERDRARQAVAPLEQQRDAAVAERDRARLALTAQRQQRALVAEELRVTRTSLSQSRAESEAAQNLNVPLQDDHRRANALLVAHAEELRRGAARIHELEEPHPQPSVWPPSPKWRELKPANLVPRLARRSIALDGCPCGSRLSGVEKTTEPRSTVSTLGSSSWKGSAAWPSENVTSVPWSAVGCSETRVGAESWRSGYVTSLPIVSSAS